MEKEYKNLPMEISIKDIILMESLQGMESIIGLMAAFSRAIL
jgi:hypothetical protein